MGHELPTAVAADFAAADAAVVEWRGVRGVEVPAAALRAANAGGVVWLAGVIHRRRLRHSSAKLTRPRLGVRPASVPRRTAPWIDAAMSHPTRQSSQWL